MDHPRPAVAHVRRGARYHRPRRADALRSRLAQLHPYDAPRSPTLWRYAHVPAVLPLDRQARLLMLVNLGQGLLAHGRQPNLARAAIAP